MILISTPVASQWFVTGVDSGLENWLSGFSRIPLSRAFEIAIVKLGLE